MSQKLDELLLRWEDRRRAGKPASVEELCRDCPDLREQLRAKVQALEKMDQILNLKSVGTVPTNGRPRTRYDDLRPNQEPVPGYRLEKMLGKGGFGEVWKAIGPGGFAVALKFVSLNGHLGASEVRSLDVIKTVHHPNLLATFGSWQANGFLIIAMELADRALLDRLNEAVAQGLSGIPGDELIRYMQDAAKGIDYLSQPDGRMGDSTKAVIQHRDIKPQNILLMGGGIKIGDFGLLRILKTTVTPENGSLTLAYAAPEFLSGRAARSSDQYSLAVTYCHLRGGRLPFVGHAGQVMEGHLKHPPDLSMLPEQERSAVARALAKEPEKRWPTCAAFMNELADCSNHRSLITIRMRYLLLSAFATAVLLTSFWIWKNGAASPEPEASGPIPSTKDKPSIDAIPRKMFLADVKEIALHIGPKDWHLGKGEIGDSGRTPISLCGAKSPKGLGMHPPSDGAAFVRYKLDGQGLFLEATVGLGDTSQGLLGKSHVVFEVLGDENVLWRSEAFSKPRVQQPCKVDIANIDILELRVHCKGNFYSAGSVWVCLVRAEYSDGRSQVIAGSDEL